MTAAVSAGFPGGSRVQHFQGPSGRPEPPVVSAGRQRAVVATAASREVRTCVQAPAGLAKWTHLGLLALSLSTVTSVIPPGAQDT